MSFDSLSLYISPRMQSLKLEHICRYIFSNILYRWSSFCMERCSGGFIIMSLPFIRVPNFNNGLYISHILSPVPFKIMGSLHELRNLLSFKSIALESHECLHYVKVATRENKWNSTSCCPHNSLYCCYWIASFQAHMTNDWLTEHPEGFGKGLSRSLLWLTTANNQREKKLFWIYFILDSRAFFTKTHTTNTSCRGGGWQAGFLGRCEEEGGQMTLTSP